MFDMAGGVGPPDQCDNSADEGDQQHKSCRIEPVLLAIPILSLANHSTLPSVRSSCCGDHTKNEGMFEAQQGLPYRPSARLLLLAALCTFGRGRAVFRQLAFQRRDRLPQIAVLELGVDGGGIVGNPLQHGTLVGMEVGARSMRPVE